MNLHMNLRLNLCLLFGMVLCTSTRRGCKFEHSVCSDSESSVVDSLICLSELHSESFNDKV